MIRRFSFSFLLTVICVACESNGDGCEEGYVRQYGANGTEWCIEGYAEENIKDYNSGESYYHKKYGLITLIDNTWFNKHNQVIRP